MNCVLECGPGGWPTLFLEPHRSIDSVRDQRTFVSSTPGAPTTCSVFLCESRTLLHARQKVAFFTGQVDCAWWP